MKRFIICCLLIVVATIAAIAQSIKGSDTTLPLTQKWAEEYMKLHPQARISVTGGGSGVGIAALEKGNTDIAMSSRSMKHEELERLRLSNRKPVELIVAYDALAVVVNPDNPVSKLTREQLEDIFRGKITNWKHVGGRDQKIIVFTRESSSGTYDFFLQKVLQRHNYAPSALSMPATGTIQEAIKGTPGGIGYVGISYIDHMKPIAVSFDHGRNYYLPNIENASDGKYPIMRPLIYYYLMDDKAKVNSFIDFIQSAKGREITEKLGYIPAND